MLAFLHLATSAGCAGGESVAAQRDPEPSPEATEPDTDPAVSAESQAVADACEGLPVLVDTLRTPETPVARYHLNAPCEALGQGFLLENTSAEPVEVTGLGVIPGTFSLAHDELPLTIAAGERVRLELHYRSSRKAGADGMLQVQTPEGCSEIEVQAGATDASFLTQSDIAVDFGNVDPGATVDREFTLRHHGAVDSEAEVWYFRAEADGFSVVDPPTPPIDLAPCESLRYSMRFDASLEPGPVRATLSWSTKIHTESSTGEMSAAVPLFANVR